MYTSIFVLLLLLLVGSEASLSLVANFSHQVTGVTVTLTGRIFVTFPRWTEDSPVSLAEVNPVTGTISAYPPNGYANEWRNANKAKLNASLFFICMQSVIAHPNGNSVWALDSGAPALSFIVPGGPKLVEIDLETNQTRRAILFDTSIAPQGSYLNDVRFHGSHAYITDSGVIGALIVVDLKSGQARRLLHGHPSTQADPNVMVTSHATPIRRPDGRGVEFSADGIALSPDGSTLYWQALQGRILYSIDTLFLHCKLADDQLGNRVRAIGLNGPADGLLISRRHPDLMYITSIEKNILLVRNLTNGKIRSMADQFKSETFPVQYNIRWPDTLAEGPDGSIYVTASHIQDSAFFNIHAPIQLATELWRFNINH